MTPTVQLTNALHNYKPVILALTDVWAIEDVLGGGMHGEMCKIRVYGPKCAECGDKSFSPMVFLVRETMEQVIAKFQHAEEK